MRASDEERMYQCLTRLFTEICNLDKSAEDERGLCKEYRINEAVARKMAKQTN